MLVTYINHSSFLVETERYYLLFDYFKGELPSDIDGNKPIYVFASHKHGDHYSAKIFNLKERFSKVYYILSKEISYHVPEEFKEGIFFVEAHKTYQIDLLSVETLKSTDLGVAFLINAEGKLIYHAGDLNCWVWMGASKAENNNMIKCYLNELEHLSQKKIFLAFVPLDPRQEEYFDMGMKYFLDKADAEHIFPMHMWEDYDVIKRFKAMPEYREYVEKILDIHAPLDCFNMKGI